MNFTLLVVGFPGHELRFKGIRRQETVANIINYTVRALADAYGAGEPDAPDASLESELFWSKISERPVFICDDQGAIVVRDVHDDVITVAEGFLELDTGVVAGERGWIGFRGVTGSACVLGTSFALSRRDVFLMTGLEMRGIVAHHLREEVSTVTLCDAEGEALSDRHPLHGLVNESGRIELTVRLPPRVDVVVIVADALDIAAVGRDRPHVIRDRFEFKNVAHSTSLGELRKSLETEHGVIGPGFVDWEAPPQREAVGLLHPDTLFADLVNGRDDALRLTFVVASRPPPWRPRQASPPGVPLAAAAPSARIKLVRRSLSVDLPLPTPPFRASELVQLLYDRGYIDSPAHAVLYCGHDVVGASEDVWAFVPRGLSPLVLLSVDE